MESHLDVQYYIYMYIQIYKNTPRHSIKNYKRLSQSMPTGYEVIQHGRPDKKPTHKFVDQSRDAEYA